MWAKKINYILKNSLRYPFNNFSKMGVLLYKTFAVLFVFYFIDGYYSNLSWFLDPYTQAPEENYLVSPIASYIKGLLNFLVTLPLKVSIIRNVVGDDAFYISLFKHIFAYRQMRYVWTGLKVMSFSLLFLGLILILDAVMMNLENFVLSGFLAIIMAVTFFFIVYIFSRISLATTLAALDNDTPVRSSWRQMQGNILLFLAALCPLVIVCGLIYIFIEMFLVNSATFLIYSEIFLPRVVFAIFIGFFETIAYFIVLIPLSAFSGYFYLVVTNPDAFNEE